MSSRFYAESDDEFEFTPLTKKSSTTSSNISHVSNTQFTQIIPTASITKSQDTAIKTRKQTFYEEASSGSDSDDIFTPKPVNNLLLGTTDKAGNKPNNVIDNQSLFKEISAAQELADDFYDEGLVTQSKTQNRTQGNVTKSSFASSSKYEYLAKNSISYSPENRPDLDSTADYKPVIYSEFSQKDEPIYLLRAAQTSTDDSNTFAGLCSSDIHDIASESNVTVNRYIARHLISHQVEGVKWLYSKCSAAQGCVLGDDMGMGKTVQIAALFAALFDKSGTLQDKANMREKKRHDHDALIAKLKNGNINSSSGSSSNIIHKSSSSSSSSSGSKYPLLYKNPESVRHERYMRSKPCLVVCPKSLVDNWKSELLVWGYFLLEVLSSEMKSEEVDELIRRALCCQVEIIIVSYSQVTTFVTALSKIQWEVIVYDEGHTLKNDKTQQYKSVMEINLAVSRVMLTGTPIQNDLKELWALLYLINNKQFFEKSAFVKEFEKPIKLGNSKSADETVAAKGDLMRRKLHKILKSCMLSRKKEELQGDHALKGKDEVVVLCDLTPLQAKLYQHVLSLPDFDNVRYHSAPCPCESGEKRSKCCDEFRIPYLRGQGGDVIDSRAVIWRQRHHGDTPCDEDKRTKCPLCVLLPCLNKLGKIASHPALLQCDPHSADSVKQQEIKQFAREALTPELLEAIGGDTRSTRFMTMKNTETSGKLRTLQEMLKIFTSNGEKTLVFSLSTKVLDIIEAFVKSRGWRSLRLDGQTQSKKRQQMVNEFNKDRDLFIFLISSRAGGLGLNLSTARKVVIFDVDWNPTVDMQSQDRAYRIGQKEHVSVYRLVSKGTVEELAYMRQLYKQQLQNSVLTYSRKGNKAKGAAQFEGVEGEAGMRGELFGIENLFQYSNTSILQDLRQRYAAGAVPGVIPAGRKKMRGVGSNGSGGTMGGNVGAVESGTDEAVNERNAASSPMTVSRASNPPSRASAELISAHLHQSSSGGMSSRQRLNAEFEMLDSLEVDQVIADVITEAVKLPEAVVNNNSTAVEEYFSQQDQQQHNTDREEVPEMPQSPATAVNKSRLSFDILKSIGINLKNAHINEDMLKTAAHANGNNISGLLPPGMQETLSDGEGAEDDGEDVFPEGYDQAFRRKSTGASVKSSAAAGISRVATAVDAAKSPTKSPKKVSTKTTNKRKSTTTAASTVIVLDGYEEENEVVENDKTSIVSTLAVAGDGSVPKKVITPRSRLDELLGDFDDSDSDEERERLKRKRSAAVSAAASSSSLNHSASYKSTTNTLISSVLARKPVKVVHSSVGGTGGNSGSGRKALTESGKAAMSRLAAGANQSKQQSSKSASVAALTTPQPQRRSVALDDFEEESDNTLIRSATSGSAVEGSSSSSKRRRLLPGTIAADGGGSTAVSRAGTSELFVRSHTSSSSSSATKLHKPSYL